MRGCHEIVRELESECIYFVDVDSISKSDLFTMLEKVKQLVDQTYNKTDGITRDLITELFSEINSKGQVIGRDEFFEKTKSKIESNLRDR